MEDAKKLRRHARWAGGRVGRRRGPRRRRHTGGEANWGRPPQAQYSAAQRSMRCRTLPRRPPSAPWCCFICLPARPPACLPARPQQVAGACGAAPCVARGAQEAAELRGGEAGPPARPRRRAACSAPPARVGDSSRPNPWLWCDVLCPAGRRRPHGRGGGGGAAGPGGGGCDAPDAAHQGGRRQPWGSSSPAASSSSPVVQPPRCAAAGPGPSSAACRQAPNVFRPATQTSVAPCVVAAPAGPGLLPSCLPATTLCCAALCCAVLQEDVSITLIDGFDSLLNSYHK